MRWGLEQLQVGGGVQGGGEAVPLGTEEKNINYRKPQEMKKETGTSEFRARKKGGAYPKTAAGEGFEEQKKCEGAGQGKGGGGYRSRHTSWETDL